MDTTIGFLKAEILQEPFKRFHGYFKNFLKPFKLFKSKYNCYINCKAKNW